MVIQLLLITVWSLLGCMSWAAVLTLTLVLI